MEEKAKQIIHDNIFMVLATSNDNNPWNTPVYYAFDDNYNFYWYSRKTTQHSENILNNNAVMVIIFNSSPREATGEAVYMQGKAYEIQRDEISHATEVYAKRAATHDEEKQQLITTEDFLYDSELRMYKFVPDTFYMNTAEKWHGKWMDKRFKVSIKG